MKIHPLVTIDRVEDACMRQETTLDNPGFCMDCGAEVEGCEPDARGYDCEVCDAKGTVYGAMEVALCII
jgi:hypothetical protein